jgi:hypothetical protein
MLLLVLRKIRLEEGAVRQLDGLVVAQISEAGTAPVIRVVSICIVESISSYSLPSTAAVAIVHRGLELQTYFTAHEACILIQSIHFNSFL